MARGSSTSARRAVIHYKYVGQGRSAEETTATPVRGVAARKALVTGGPERPGRHRSVRDVFTQGTVPGASLETKNFYVGDHGACLKMGSIPWSESWDAPLKVSTVENRSRMLVSAFGEVASRSPRDVVRGSTNADTFRKMGGGDKPPKVWRVEEDAVAGVYASPGERFDILLDPPKRGVAHGWRAPDLGSMHAEEVLDFCDDLEPGTRCRWTARRDACASSAPL